MGWAEWIEENRFTLFRTAIIQEAFIDLLLDHLPKGSQILETGFGQGTTLVLLHDLEFDVFGRDIESAAVDNFRDRFPFLAKKVGVGNLLESGCYKAFGHRFGAITHQGVLEHFSDQQIVKILRMQKRYADKIIFDVPNNQRQDLSDEGAVTRFEPPDFWSRIIETAGLKHERFGRTYDYGDEFIPKALKKFDSPLMREIGRSSMFVCW